MLICLSVLFVWLQVKDLRDHQLDNRMESFFLAETIKYLYLLFDPDHFLHGGDAEGGMSWEEGGEGGQCVLGAGGYIFNTEAHPLDPAALYCCSRHAQDRQELRDILLRLSQPTGESTSQSEPPTKQTERPPPSQSESIALKAGEKKTPPLLTCPVQPFSARLSILGQVFTDNSWPAGADMMTENWFNRWPYFFRCHVTNRSRSRSKLPSLKVTTGVTSFFLLDKTTFTSVSVKFSLRNWPLLLIQQYELTYLSCCEGISFLLLLLLFSSLYMKLSPSGVQLSCNGAAGLYNRATPLKITQEIRGD